MQKNPIQNNKPHVVDQVIEDLHKRKEEGIRKYGTALQPFNGRDSLQDLYEELLDAVQYLKQLQIELGDNSLESNNKRK